MIDTDVLVVGCGPGGLTAAMALARRGVRVVAISKHGQLAPTPRAHVTNQRSFEILRDFGLEDEAMAQTTSYALLRDEIFLRSLTGPEFARITGPIARADDSPCAIADLPQHLLEPVLHGAATRLGAHVRFDCELVSFEQDADGVTALVEDHLSGERTTIRARYLIGADGGRSTVAAALDLPFEGPGELGGSINILFDADLERHVAHRPGLLYFIVRLPRDAGGAGLAFLRCIRPWNRWMLTKGYASGSETPAVSFDEAADVVRDHLGLPDLDLRVTGVDPWTLHSLRATRYSEGRVFCLGDAVHRHVPSNGLGSNMAIQDAYNLAWKLDLVLRGMASPDLLASYDAERVPEGRKAVERATKSLESYPPILAALGVADGCPYEQARDAIDQLGAAGAAGVARREALRSAIGAKVYEFHARGIELNQMYRSAAIIDEGQQPMDNGRDLELCYCPTTCPGARLLHAWVQRAGHAVSTLDLVGRGRFTLLTGIGGDAWRHAAAQVAGRFGIDLAVVAIGHGCEIGDLRFEWHDRREIDEDGCLLVRPDGYVAWRCRSLASDAETRLMRAVAAVLGRPDTGT